MTRTPSNSSALRWNVTPKEAVQLQKQLRDDVRLVPLEQLPALVGGCDVSMNRFAKEGFAGFVTLTYPELRLVDHAVVKDAIPMPYVPGLLSFREIPMLAKAWEQLKTKPHVLIADGIGIAHPRRLGIASHLGLVLGIPTIGCAKSVLTGIYEEPGNEPGDVSFLYDKYDTEEIIGAALRTKRNVKPVFVSPGHLITLQESIDLVYSCVRKHRLPEATRLAHNTVNEYRIADLHASGQGVAL
ncbi:MAG TPA: deoxyribonuclease V [Candidatus Paceibacterota bacterium]|jgi:deoxyribonuclease V|nr:deoxyribonuclease V [Candidatus Paceibacterota bacterium]